MISQPAVRKLPGLKSRVSAALRATARTNAIPSNDALEELAAAVEELETVADTLAEAARGLEAERRRYQELFDLAPDAYIVVDRGGRILDANGAASKLLGVADGWLAGTPLAVYLKVGEARKLRDRLAAPLSEAQMEWSTWVCPRGSPQFPARVRACSVRDDQGSYCGARLLLYDISDQVRERADVLSLVSHEVRAPVSLVRGYLEMMLDGSLGDVGARAREVLPIALERCDEINALADQAAQSAGLAGGWHRLDREDVDLRDLVSDAVSAAAAFAAMAGRTVRLVPTEEPVRARVDARRIRTIVRNLIENALKYSSEGSEVRCEVRGAGDEATVAVSDRGRGIPASQLDSLFTRFGRVVTPETQHVGGTGLGLYLSRELARLHGGDLRVETVEGEGSTFTLALPGERR